VNLTVDPLLTRLLVHWAHTLGEHPQCETSGAGKLCCRITSASGCVYFLKEVGDIEQRDAERQEKVEADLAVLRHLDACGVPVAVPLLTNYSKPYAQEGSHFYTLSLALPTKYGDPAMDPRRMFHNLGKAIGRLHCALVDYPGEIRSWRMDLPKRILAEAVPVLMDHLDEVGQRRLLRVVEALREPVQQRLADLPSQHIHGDCHGGNVLLDGERVSGFIDLDHLPFGPRIWDLGYYLADRAKNAFQDPEEMETWFEILPDLLDGYAEEIELSREERQAILYVMLGVQLIFAAWFCAPVDRPDLVQFNLEAFYWIYEHQWRIMSIL
jgi:Ser/Thr protein kinase RdoA (MazF antagonist)